MSYIPNAISVLRLILSPLIIPFTARDVTYGFVLFFVLSLSDALDGFLARKFRWESRTGKFLDPLADKILLFCGLLSVSYVVELRIPSYLLYLLLVRDLYLIIGTSFLRPLGFVPEPTLPGKAATFLTVAVVVLVYTANILETSSLWSVIYPLYASAVLSILISWMQYTAKAVRFIKERT